MVIRDAYNQWAESYDSDRNLTRDLDQTVTRETLAHQHFKTILELGCGTGKNTAFYAQIADRVCAFDFSESMISEAKAKVHADHVMFAITDLTQSWPCAAQSADLAVCNLVLEHIADLGFIFAEAARVLGKNGCFFVSELHPFKQYEGKKATFTRDQDQIEIPAFIHHLSDFLDAGKNAGFALKSLKESWHEADQGKPPRLVSFLFENDSINL